MKAEAARPVREPQIRLPKFQFSRMMSCFSLSFGLPWPVGLRRRDESQRRARFGSRWCNDGSGVALPTGLGRTGDIARDYCARGLRSIEQPATRRFAVVIRFEAAREIERDKRDAVLCRDSNLFHGLTIHLGASPYASRRAVVRICYQPINLRSQSADRAGAALVPWGRSGALCEAS